MKLTVEKLTQIIREEVENTLSEAEPGDLGSPKRQRKYGSREIGNILIMPASGDSAVQLGSIIPELEALDVAIAPTRRGWKAIDLGGTEEDMRARMASDSAFASLIQRLAGARQKITERFGSTTHRIVYPFRTRGKKDGDLYVKFGDGEIAEIPFPAALSEAERIHAPSPTPPMPKEEKPEKRKKRNPNVDHSDKVTGNMTDFGRIAEKENLSEKIDIVVDRVIKAIMSKNKE